MQLHRSLFCRPRNLRLRAAPGGCAGGFSLIEVMVALLVFSIGVLGMAGLLVIAIKTNHSAYLRTQASFIAQSMGDRMRGNSRAVWAGTYARTYPLGGAAGSACTAGSPCGFEALAERDNRAFDRDLSNFLPNATATVRCTRGSGPARPDTTGRPPYDGLCTIVVNWSEASLARDTATPLLQTFAWKFQP
ncbi:MAG TPA: type IV pilus modification protein PilV [Tahibacter sp.]|nr:type IV pilus modification protein PilV [Tahibacter sp.]